LPSISAITKAFCSAGSSSMRPARPPLACGGLAALEAINGAPGLAFLGAAYRLHPGVRQALRQVPQRYSLLEGACRGGVHGLVILAYKVAGLRSGTSRIGAARRHAALRAGAETLAGGSGGLSKTGPASCLPNREEIKSSMLSGCLAPSAPCACWRLRFPLSKKKRKKRISASGMKTNICSKSSSTAIYPAPGPRRLWICASGCLPAGW
jgi:hypothetical protein